MIVIVTVIVIVIVIVTVIVIVIVTVYYDNGMENSGSNSNILLNWRNAIVKCLDVAKAR